MPKHKQVTMWVAYIKGDRREDNSEVHCLPIQVVETKKQYRLLENDGKAYRAALIGTGYKRVINKQGNIWLYDTEGEALNALDTYYIRVEKSARARLDRAQENLFLTTEALREYNKRNP